MALHRKRPLGITLLALIMLWVGCLGSITLPIISVETFRDFNSSLNHYLHRPALSAVAVTLFLILWFGAYVVYAFVGIGLWRLRRWSWKTLVVIQLIAMPVYALMSIQFARWMNDWIMGAAVAVFCVGFTLIILWYLNRMAVREAFLAGPAGRWMSLLNNPSWLSRSRVWVKVLCAAAGVCLLVGIFAAGLFVSVEGSFKKSEAFHTALNLAQHTPCVIARLGSPVVQKGFTTGSMSTSGSGDTGSAELSIPVRGPKGRGSLWVAAKKQGGQWVIASLSLDQAGVQTAIVPAEGAAGCR